jgi:hypothetical protein
MLCFGSALRVGTGVSGLLGEVSRRKALVRDDGEATLRLAV